MSKVIDGKVVNIISEENHPVRLSVKVGKHVVAVDIPAETYDAIIAQNRGTIWGEDVLVTIDDDKISLEINN